MRCILMNKNTPVLEAEYNSGVGVFINVYELFNMDYAPYHLRISCVELSEWFKNRGIPSFRDQLDLLMHRLNVHAPSELLDKAFGLSLSDPYWLKPKDLDIFYDKINFFENDFEYAPFMDASLSKNSDRIQNESSLYSPNNTADGMLRKAWIIEDGIRYLLKGGYKSETLQPFNEVLASEICRRLGFDHVEYSLAIYKDMVVSKCPCFIDVNSELITARQIMDDTIDDYDSYIKKLESEGIEDARIKMENMFILDYLMLNEDRHLNNFGIIRNVNTLKWMGVAPIFDNGQSLNIQYYDDNEMYVVGEGKFFYEIKSFNEIIQVVQDLNRIDIDKLQDLPAWFDDLLHQYQHMTYYSNQRIHKLCVLLNRQIHNLKFFLSS